MQVIIRTDASVDIGAGHLMRCLALADELRQRNARVGFVTRAAAQPWGEIIAAHGHDVTRLPADFPGWERDAAETSAALLASDGCDWLVVDHYRLDRQWEEAVRPNARNILAIDDLGRSHGSDMLLDQNVLDDGPNYGDKLPAACTRLLGPRYALLRPEFRQARRDHAEHGASCRQLLISFGGTDPTGETGKAIEAFLLADIEGAHAQVLLGPGNAAAEALCRKYGNHPRLTLHHRPDAVAAIMASTDLAIGAGGVSTWERATLGLPSIVISVAENQERLAEDLAKDGCHCYLGRSRDTHVADMAASLSLLARNPHLRGAFGRSSMALCDGAGASRVARCLAGAPALALRRATAADGPLLLAWRNAPEVRRYSRHAGFISSATHEQWLDRTLTDPARHLLIAEKNAVAIGSVRFDAEGDQARISIYLDPGRIGTGLGTELLAAAEDWLRANVPEVSEVRACVVADNLRSIAMFEHAGYQPLHREYRKLLKASGQS